MDQAIHVEREIAAALLKVQKARDRLFDPNVFASPAWDIVLTLCAHPEGLSLFELHDEMAIVPEGVLSRWIIVLEKAQILQLLDQLPGPPAYFLTSEAKEKTMKAFNALVLSPFA